MWMNSCWTTGKSWKPVIEKKPSKASKAMQMHVRHAKNHFIKYLKENPWLI